MGLLDSVKSVALQAKGFSKDDSKAISNGQIPGTGLDKKLLASKINDAKNKGKALTTPVNRPADILNSKLALRGLLATELERAGIVIPCEPDHIKAQGLVVAGTVVEAGMRGKPPCFRVGGKAGSTAKTLLGKLF
jgi:hypothetical protein